MPTIAYVNEPKTVAVKLIDNESGINLAKSKWVYTNSKSPIGTDNIIQYTKEFRANSDTVVLTANSTGTWYLHVLAVDNANNMVEKISETGVTITAIPTTASRPNQFNYTGGIQTYSVPVTGIYKLEVWRSKWRLC